MNRWKWIGLGLLILVVIPFTVIVAKELLEPQVRGINLRYISGAEAASILTDKLGPRAVEGWADHEVFVRGSKAQLDKVVDTLQKEDQPPPQVALKFQIIEADGFAQTDQAIAAVESVLRNLFRFKGYRLAAEAFVRARAQTTAQQTISGADDTPYAIEVKVGDVVRRGGKASAELETRLWTGPDTQMRTEFNQVLSTSVNVPDGQTVVLGTARPSSKHAALILVVTPEIK